MNAGTPTESDSTMFGRKILAALAVSGGVSALAVHLSGGDLAPLVAGLAASAAVLLGAMLGGERHARATRLRLYNVADELVQYRAFTRLLRAQSERIIGLTGDAAMAIATGLQEMDERAAALARRVEEIKAQAPDGAALGDLHGQAVAITEPMLDMVGKLQFQDVTQQQLMFLSRLSLILDDHMSELARLLGDRRSLDRGTRFKELFDQALNETVMTSQRNDHHTAVGVQLFEAAGPAVEMFSTGEEGVDAHTRG